MARCSRLVVMVLAAAATAATAQAPEPEISLPRVGGLREAVNFYGAASDTHFIYRKGVPGELVRVLRIDGEWAQIAPPGDLVVYVAMRFEGREYLTSNGSDLAYIVNATSLNIRGQPKADDRVAPPLGQLDRGDAVIVLDEVEDDWARIAVPVDRVEVWVSAKALEFAPDAEEGQRAFQQGWQERRAEVLRSGSISRPRLEFLMQDKDLIARTEEATQAFQRELDKPLAERDTKAVEASLTELRDRWPEGTSERQRIDAMLTVANSWVEAKKEVLARDAMLQAREAQAADLERRHREDLDRILKQTDERIAEQKLPARTGRFLYTGWVRKVEKVRGITRAGPDYYLDVGGQRVALLESDRYDLADFENQLIGIWTLEQPERVRPGDTIKTLRIRRLEIVHNQR